MCKRAKLNVEVFAEMCSLLKVHVCERKNHVFVLLRTKLDESNFFTGLSAVQFKSESSVSRTMEIWNSFRIHLHPYQKTSL